MSKQDTSADEQLITTFMGVDVKKLTSEDIHALSSYAKQRELALLERLEKQNTIFKIHTYNERGVKHTATAGEGVPLSAIEAERNKLKESKND